MTREKQEGPPRGALARAFDGMAPQPSQASALTAWLAGLRSDAPLEEHDHTPEEADQFWTRLFAGPATQGAEPLGVRVVAAWRIVRALGMATGLLREDETLGAAWDGEESPWDTPASQCGRPRSLPASAARHANAPLLDTPLHPHALEDPEARARYNLSAGQAAARLQTRLPDPFPTRAQIEDFEERLVSATHEELVRHGDRATADWLAGLPYLFTPLEAHHTILMVDETQTRRTTRSTEQWRSRLLGYLDELRRSAQHACDIRTERWAIRDMASISGVLRADANDIGLEMERAVDSLDLEDQEETNEITKRREAL